MSLLGLVRHMTDVERWWFRMNLRGEQPDGPFGPSGNLSGDFDDLDSMPAEQVWEAYRDECAAADAAAVGPGLESTFRRPARQRHRPALGVRPHDRGVRPPQRPRRPPARARGRHHRRLTHRAGHGTAGSARDHSRGLPLDRPRHAALHAGSRPVPTDGGGSTRLLVVRLDNPAGRPVDTVGVRRPRHGWDGGSRPRPRRSAAS